MISKDYVWTGLDFKYSLVFTEHPLSNHFHKQRLYLFVCVCLYRLFEKDTCQLAWTMNMVSIHSSYIDNLEETIINASDLSFMWLVVATSTSAL